MWEEQSTVVDIVFYMDNALFTYCSKNLGFKNQVGNAFYGKFGDYGVSIFDAGGRVSINISYFLELEQKEKISELEDKAKFDPCLISLGATVRAGESGLCIRFPQNPDSIEKIESVLRTYTDYLNAENFPKTERRRETPLLQDGVSEAARRLTQPITGSRSFMRHSGVPNSNMSSAARGKHLAAHSRPLFAVTPYSEYGDPDEPVRIFIDPPEEEEKRLEYQGGFSIFMGTLGAIIGGGLFSILYVVAYLIFASGVNMRNSIIYFAVLIPWGGLCGYRVFHGDQRKAVQNIIICSVTLVICVIVSVFAAGYIVSEPHTPFFRRIAMAFSTDLWISNVRAGIIFAALSSALVVAADYRHHRK